jgi:hypothetical protein
MSKARYILYCHAIPDSPTQDPKVSQVFFCRSKEAIDDVLTMLDAYSKEATPSDTNPRRARGVAVVGIDQEVFEEQQEGRRPATAVGDSFVSIKEAARALGVSRAFLHRELGRASKETSEDFAFPTAKIRGVFVAFVDDLPD